MFRSTALLALTALGSVLAMCQMSQSLPQPAAAKVDIKQKKRIAAESGASVVNPPLAAYVQELGNRLAKEAGTPVISTVRIVYSNDTRASLSGDGVLEMTTTLLCRTATEAELAGVIAHLTAHVASRQESLQTAPAHSSPEPADSCALSGHVQERGDVARVEAETNSRAVRYLAAAGYDPLEMLAFFTKLRYEEPRYSELFSVDDLLALRSQLEERLPPPSGYVLSTSTFGGIQRCMAPLHDRDPSRAQLKKAPIAGRPRME